MTNIKHVLVLFVLVLPMFVLAPTMVASPNEALTSPTVADSSIPAANIGQALRVAVYVESDTTLPAYATGGNYTTYHGNIISFLEGQGYVVTSMTTQDILDRKLLASKYDAFVLANQLPRDTIIDHVKDYWLAGGGILSFQGSIGYCFYAGLIDESFEGDFDMAPIASPGHWGIDNTIYEVDVNERHPITQAYELGDSFAIAPGDSVILNMVSVSGLQNIIGDEITPLVTWNNTSEIPLVATFDDPNRGGKIVQIPGNCSTIPVWQRPIITEAIDWLAPKPKARIAFDFTHTPYYGVDDWDTEPSYAPRYNHWRDFLVNHSFVCDKLYPTGSNLTAADIAPFDVLIVAAPNQNYSASEISLFRTYVESGNGLFYLGDWGSINYDGQSRFNELMEPWGLAIDLDGSNAGTFVTTDLANHPTFELVSSIGITGGDFLTISGDAYSLVNQSTDVIIGAAEPALGRVAACGDINIFDHNHYDDEYNVEFGINLIDWLSSANSDVLIYSDDNDVSHKWISPVALAANELGLSYTLTRSHTYLSMYITEYDFDLVVVDSPIYTWGLSTMQNFADYINGGGKFVASYYWAHNAAGDPLWSLLGFEPLTSVTDSSDMHIWAGTHPIFNLPCDYGTTRFEPTADYGTEGSTLHVFDNATSLAGMTSIDTENQSTVVIANGGRTLFNAYLIDQFQGDLDNSTYLDNFELWLNELGFMYFDRPTIDHPDDVTYMETETGNEISWTPAAPAGPWEYVIRENGSIVESGLWGGGVITINVDGVVESITDYQLTAFDRLGYSASDSVILNVTEYIAPPTTTTTTTTGTTTDTNTSTDTGTGGGEPLDTTLILIVAAAVGGVVVILIVIMIVKKK